MNKYLQSSMISLILFPLYSFSTSAPDNTVICGMNPYQKSDSGYILPLCQAGGLPIWFILGRDPKTFKITACNFTADNDLDSRYDLFNNMVDSNGTQYYPDDPYQYLTSNGEGAYTANGNNIHYNCDLENNSRAAAAAVWNSVIASENE
ncbi:MAG: hypothetical protein ACPGUD_06115 [Parashewanella sp.]